MPSRPAQRPLRLVAPAPAPELVPPLHDELAELARRAARSDAKATRTLLVAVLPQILRVVRRVLGAQHPDVEDVTQESASSFVQALSRFRGESSVLHFACRTAVLSAMSVRRRQATQKRARLNEAELPLEQISSGTNEPERELLQRRKTAAVRELLDTLPLAQAEVLALHCMLGYTVSEIAAAASISPETVRSRARLAKLSLRERLESDPRFRGLLEEEP
jgi:RNA polymerase sigma factor (sigma-70 family)